MLYVNVDFSDRNEATKISSLVYPVLHILGGQPMKTKDLIELLERNGWKFKRHGANHDIYVKDGQRESVVRHRETDEELAKAIIKRRGLK